jgi:hypothetical protein
VPVPCFNVINGRHYEHLSQSFNEFLIVPDGTDSIDFAIEMAVAVFQKLAHVLTEHLGQKPQLASSYGYAAPLNDPEVILALMQRAIDACGYTGRIAVCVVRKGLRCFAFRPRVHQIVDYRRRQSVSKIAIDDHGARIVQRGWIGTDRRALVRGVS